MGFTFGRPSLPWLLGAARGMGRGWGSAPLLQLLALSLLQGAPPGPPQLSPRTTDSARLPLLVTHLVSSSLSDRDVCGASTLFLRGAESGDIMYLGQA